MPWRNTWQPTPVILPGESHGQRSLAGYGPISSVQPFSHVWLNVCNPMDCSMPGFPVRHQLPKLLKLMSIQLVIPSNNLILSFPSPPALNLSQHQGLFQWVSSSHQVAKVLEFHHQSFQWIFRTDFLYLVLPGLISLPSKGLSRVFSNTTVQKHQFFGA